MITKKSKGGQVAIFVVVAIIIVAALVSFFIFKDKIFKTEISAEFRPVYDYYLSCIEGEVLRGADILGNQGGYIELPEFKPGSDYAPFSSQLDFFGMPVQYWYYISGNGVVEEKVPSLRNIEKELSGFLKEELVNGCDFSFFE